MKDPTLYVPDPDEFKECVEIALNMAKLLPQDDEIKAAAVLLTLLKSFESVTGIDMSESIMSSEKKK